MTIQFIMCLGVLLIEKQHGRCCIGSDGGGVTNHKVDSVHCRILLLTVTQHGWRSFCYQKAWVTTIGAVEEWLYN